MEPIQSFTEVQLMLNRYFNALDSRDYPTLLDCLTDDVDWKVSSVRSGRADVAQAMEERPANAVVRHLVTNLDLRAEGDELSAFFLLSTFVHFTVEGDALPYPIAPPVIVADMRAKIVSTPDGPKMRQLLASIIFKKPDA